MIYDLKVTRREAIVKTGAAIATMPLTVKSALAQITELDGFDSIWRDTEEALRYFFGKVNYFSSGIQLIIPRHAEVGRSVPITVKVDCEMNKFDYPKVVHVLANKNPGPHVMSAYFLPEAGKAEFSTRIRLEQSQVVTVAAKISDGRHIRVDKFVDVSFGACGQDGAGDRDTVAKFKPIAKIRVPSHAIKDEIMLIRTLISHPMETGLRLDVGRGVIEARFISAFRCEYNGVSVFRARLHPAIAANPYFSFYARANESGLIKFSWYDMTNINYKKSSRIIVS